MIAVYFPAAIAFALSPLHQSPSFNPWEFSGEDSRLEMAQEANFLLGSVLVFCAFLRKKNGGSPERWLILGLLSGFLWCSNRELDQVWERHGLDLVYDSLKGVTLLPGLFALFFHFRDFLSEWLRQSWDRPFRLFYLGALIIVAGEIAGASLGMLEADRGTKRMAEEFLELLGGISLMLGAFEVFAETTQAMDPYRVPPN